MTLPEPNPEKTTMPTTPVASITSKIQLFGMTGPGRRLFGPGGGADGRGGMDIPQILNGSSTFENRSYQ
jgi:hypothetical protein